MARMVAQKNSRGFQSKLSEREHALDKHILHLLEKFSDPSFFKKKHGYNVHGQMLGKDGKMIVKVSHQEPIEALGVCSCFSCLLGVHFFEIVSEAFHHNTHH